MKRIGIGALALLVLLVTVGLLRAVQPARAQNEEGRGWIEGVVINDRAECTWDDRYTTITAEVTIKPVEGNGYRTNVDNGKGGYYTFRNLKPGLYEVFVGGSHARIRDEEVHYRPIHYFGVVVEPNRRTLLDIRVREGKELEERGKPTVPSQKAIMISDELERLKAEIAELKKQIEELKKKNP